MMEKLLGAPLLPHPQKIAQIIAFKVTHYALILVALGFAMLFMSRRQKVRQYGAMVMGLGLIFFGMGIMSQAMTPLRSYAPFMEFLKNMEQPILGILAGALFTGLVQSSAATVGIAIALASEGFLTLEAGIALALGAGAESRMPMGIAVIGGLLIGHYQQHIGLFCFYG